MKYHLSLLLVSLTIVSFAQSTTPEVVSNGGEYYENSSGSLSWTLGEPMIETLSDGTNTLTQGFQQNSYTITRISEIKDTDIIIRVYPNPTSDIINIEGINIEKGSIELFDMSGRLVLTEDIKENKHQINIQDKSVTYYIMKVYNKDKSIVMEYKICKTK